MGKVGQSVAIGLVGGGLMVGGWNAGEEQIYLAAGEFGYAKDGTITAGDKVHALGKGVGQYVGLTALNICDQLPLWTPCDKKVNKININDHVINAFGPGVVAIGGLIGAGWGAWAATGGLLGLARNRYNNGAQTASETTI